MVAIIESLIQPLPIALILLFVGYIGAMLSRPKLILCGFIGLLTLAVVSMPFFGRGLVAGLESKYTQIDVEAIPGKSIALVLSGAIDMPVSPRTRAELTHASDRLMYVFDLYQMGLLSKIVLTGGSTYPDEDVLSEAQYSIDLLLKMGIPEEMLIGEFRSRNTFENITFAEPILSGMDETKLLIVTSAAHMPRAIAVARKSILTSLYEIIAAPTDYRVALNAGKSVASIIPSSPGLNLTTMAVHEYVGWIYYKWKNYI